MLVMMSAQELANGISYSGHMYAMTRSGRHLTPAGDLRETFSGMDQVQIILLTITTNCVFCKSLELFYFFLKIFRHFVFFFCLLRNILLNFFSRNWKKQLFVHVFVKKKNKLKHLEISENFQTFLKKKNFFVQFYT